MSTSMAPCKVGTDEEAMLPTSGSDEEQAAPTSKAWRLPVAVAAAAVGVACLLCAAAWGTSSGAGAAQRPALAPLTVRALLHSDEMKDLATDNLMAMHGSALDASQRTAVHQQVARSLVDIDHAIHMQLPEEHHQLDTLEVSADQKEAAMKVLRKYGDSRMIALIHEVNVAFQENTQAQGDHAALGRRLSEKLQAKLPEIQQLSEEMFPGREVDLDAKEMPMLGKWHPKAEIDLGGSVTARRLSSLDSIHEGVRAHAQSLLESLQGGMGEKMPKAPARMLSLFGDASSHASGSSSSSGSSSTEDQAFMACVTKAVPSPPKVCKCIQDNMSDVIKMVMGFLKGKSP